MQIRTFQNDLADIVKEYASYSVKEKCYINHEDKTTLSEQQLLDIDKQLHKLIMSYVNQDSNEEDKIKENTKKLCVAMYFHSDKKEKRSPAVQWLEATLSTGNESEYCFKLAQQIQGDLLNLEQESKLGSFLAPTLEEYRRRLSLSTSFTQRLMWKQIISMLETLQTYDQNNLALAGKKFQKIALLFPLITVSACLGLFLPELTTFLALAFTAAKSNDWINQRNRTHVLGIQINSLSKTLMHLGLGFMATVAKYNIIAIKGIITQGGEVYKMLTGTIKEADAVLVTNNPLQIIPYGQSSYGRQFNSLQVLLVARPLQEYVAEQKKQWGSGLRTGKLKGRLFKEALNEISEIDQRIDDESEKMVEIAKPLSRLSSNYVVSSSGDKAVQKLNQALFFNQLYNPKPPETVLLAYEEGDELFAEL